MEIKLITLTLQCKQSREIIDLSHQISIFHGKISSGKSSLVRLINFLFGGDLEKTAAIQEELISATLSCQIGLYDVLFEREIEVSKIRVTWNDQEGDSGTLLAPLSKFETGPIWGADIFNFSDLVFYFMELSVLKVRKSKAHEDSQLVRLSIRDFFRFSYLDQDHLDSSFFRIGEPIRGEKSKDVLRFVVGYFSEKLSTLEQELENKREERIGKKNSANELGSFLEKFGFDSEEQVEAERQEAENRIKQAQHELGRLQEGYNAETHTSDKLRGNIRKIANEINVTEQAISDLEYKIEDQKTLRSELLSAKFKFAKSTSIQNVFANVVFESCPSCGSGVKKKESSENCNLCGSKIEAGKPNSTNQEEAFRLDLDSRIEDLEVSIKEHKKSLNRQKNLIIKLRTTKYDLDLRLANETEKYESLNLSAYRDIERRIATYKERVKGFDRALFIPKEISRLEEEVKGLIIKESEIREKIEEEKAKLTSASEYIDDIGDKFIEMMIEVGVPGVNVDDEVYINRKTWEVQVHPHGNEFKKWGFSNAGSGGKKTLFQVCFALALHLVASVNKLELPKILIIDTPMKNIGEDVNEDLFRSFYELLYRLANDELADRQFIIVDKEYFKPADDVKVDILERYMTPDEDENPPLIAYYRGA
ncbi:MAG: hypothetical protein RID18_01925 [Cytophagales bacterium]